MPQEWVILKMNDVVKTRCKMHGKVVAGTRQVAAFCPYGDKDREKFAPILVSGRSPCNFNRVH